MRPRELTCYGCKGGDGQPLRIHAFTDLTHCPKCKRPFHDSKKDYVPCKICQAPAMEGLKVCSSCRAERGLR